MKKDVARPVVARIGSRNRHVHLSSGTLREPELRDLVFRWRGGATGVSGRPAERARRRDRGSLRLAQSLEQARERLGLDDPIEFATIRRDEADAADEHVVDGPPGAHAEEPILHRDLSLARRHHLPPPRRRAAIRAAPRPRHAGVPPLPPPPVREGPAPRDPARALPAAPPAARPPGTAEISPAAARRALDSS